jgi:hypothetical protein
MLASVLSYLKNYFVAPSGIHDGTYTVEDGGIELPFLQQGQYFRIIGSVFNDGVYLYPANELTPETFDGSIWALAIPRDVVSLTEEMSAWETKNGTGGAYQSESFAGYTYTRATNSNGEAVTVWDAYKKRLAPYKRPKDVSMVEATRLRTPEPSPYNPYPWR